MGSGAELFGARHGLTSAAIDRMASAFEHDDLMAATGAAKS